MIHHNRPLSPHLQVYKLPLTGVISITHRMTGVMLSVGLIVFVYVVSAIAAGPEAYQALQGIMGHWLFRLVYGGFIYALFFHLCHGVRHLIWDTGRGFDKATLNRYAFYELIAALVLTLAALFLTFTG
ncbi:MAG: succinate dehydrogenase, cytochrome b556 subunit [Gammaproteobacteria bacterium HGW-Gammaproteobacteria-3]|nr:MAG: succinate dehydrogenase, cytochrome b556 subunit [Gammaproteobacteria bacterium HGW-Gammaproteobacteria-3]